MQRKKKKLFAIILAATVLLGICACSGQESETGNIESNLEQINKGIEQFSKLKNGTLKVYGSLAARNNAVESLNNADTENTSLITFVQNQKGYDFIEEVISIKEKNGETQYSAIKQVQGTLFIALPGDSSTAERINPYEWNDAGDSSQISYEPNGTLKMMAVPAKLLEHEEYIETVTKEKDGASEKYTVKTNEAYAKYMKEDAHSAEENFILHEHRESYWINEDGLLSKHQIYDAFEWTVDGISDTYILDLTVELTGCNYKKLKKIGDELPPMIMFKGELYTQSPALLDVNLDALIKIGRIESVVGSVQEPEQNNQANRDIKNAVIYKSDKNSIIVKSSGYTLYEKNHQ